MRTKDTTKDDLQTRAIYAAIVRPIFEILRRRGTNRAWLARKFNPPVHRNRMYEYAAGVRPAPIWFIKGACRALETTPEDLGIDIAAILERGISLGQRDHVYHPRLERQRRPTAIAQTQQHHALPRVAAPRARRRVGPHPSAEHTAAQHMSVHPAPAG